MSIVAILLIIAGVVGAIPAPNGNRIAWVLVALGGLLMILPL